MGGLGVAAPHDILNQSAQDAYSDFPFYGTWVWDIDLTGYNEAWLVVDTNMEASDFGCHAEGEEYRAIMRGFVNPDFDPDKGKFWLKI